MLKHIAEHLPMEGVRRHAAILRIPKRLWTYCCWTSSHGGRVAACHGLLPKSTYWNPCVLMKFHTRSTKFLMLKHIVGNQATEGVGRHAAVRRTHSMFISSFENDDSLDEALYLESVYLFYIFSICCNGNAYSYNVYTLCWKQTLQ